MTAAGGMSDDKAPLVAYRRRVVIALVLLSSGIVGVVYDANRVPKEQVVSKWLVAAIGIYQRRVSPSLGSVVRCRYTPSCSHYAVDALTMHGLWSGGIMAFQRIARCRESVPVGTYDPVPEDPLILPGAVPRGM